MGDKISTVLLGAGALTLCAGCVAGPVILSAVTGWVELLKPMKGHCCVFCSYGTVACPPIQESSITGKQPSCCG